MVEIFTNKIYMLKLRKLFAQQTTKSEEGKNMFSKGVALSLIIVTICLFAPAGWSVQKLHSAEWKLIGKDMKDCQWFYDEGNIRHLPGNRRMVWLKRMVSDEERKGEVRDKTAGNLPVEGYDRWAYELGLVELNCSVRTIRQLNVTDYDLDGRYLKSRKIAENLGVIAGDSIGEIVFKALCSPHNPESIRMIPQFPSIR